LPRVTHPAGRSVAQTCTRSHLALTITTLPFPLAAQEPYCITQARAVQTKGGACDSGNTNYRGDTDSTINLGCPALVKKVRNGGENEERPIWGGGKGGGTTLGPRSKPDWARAGGQCEPWRAWWWGRLVWEEWRAPRDPPQEASVEPPLTLDDAGGAPARGSSPHTSHLHLSTHTHTQIKGTPGYRPPSDACCSELIAWTEAGCACNADLKAQAIKENTKDLRVFAAMAKSAQILCAQKQASINDPCGAPCNGAAAAA